MPNLWTKLKNWFCSPLPVKKKVIKSKPSPVIIDPPKKDKLTFEQRLKRGEQIIEQLTKEAKEC